MSILDFVINFFLLIMIVISIFISIYLSNIFGNESNYNTNQPLVKLNWLLITNYVLLILAAILLFVNLIASSFYNVSSVTSDHYNFPFWVAIFSLIFIFISFIIYTWIYFQLETTTITNKEITKTQISNYVLGAAIITFISFFILLFYVIYEAYHPLVIIIPSIPSYLQSSTNTLVPNINSVPGRSMNNPENIGGEGNIFVNEHPSYMRTKRIQ